MKSPSLPLPRLLLLLLALAFFGVVFPIPAQARARVQLGIDVLESDGFALLKGKRVGLVTNQTGIDSRGIKTRQLLRAAKNVRLVALFSPEHGLDGTIPAGKYVSQRKDALTGLPVHSLYGPTRKPTPEMLRGLDALVYDMQDIGSRSYTYISTMVKCMEAAGENGIEFIVLDRPNPLGGVRVEGPPIELRWISFVGSLPVPYCHGMTAGELAKMANARKWVQPRCHLTVVPMRGWDREMTWDKTGLHWVPTSPNVPYSASPFYYAATGLAGEIPGFELGTGSPKPFQIAATKYLRPATFVRYLQSLDLPGIEFTPYSQGYFHGASLHIEPNPRTPLSILNVYILAAAQKAAPRSLFSYPEKRYEIFYKCYGSDSIRKALERGVSPSRIVSEWKPYNTRFADERKPFLLY